MEAKLYKINIFRSSLEWTHQMGETIWEIYIPQIDICFNEAGGCFKRDKPRNLDSDIIDIEVDIEDVIRIDQFEKAYKNIEELRKEMFDNIKNTDWSKWSNSD